MQNLMLLSMLASASLGGGTYVPYGASKPRAPITKKASKEKKTARKRQQAGRKNARKRAH